MRYIKILILLLITNNIYAQGYNFLYKLDYKPSTALDSIISDFYLLKIKPAEKKSLFTNYNYYKTDTLMASLKEKSDLVGNVNLDLSLLSKINYSIGVEKINDKKYIYRYFDGDTYKIPFSKELKWNIEKEFSKIENWNCQKATLKYGNRDWVAWFDTSFPISTGPYVFDNLPGLIVDIKDSKNEFHFSLKGINKNISNYKIPFIYKNAIEVSENKYKKAYKNYLLDPGRKLREGMLVDDSGEVMHINGGFSEEFIKSKTIEIQKKIEENNNTLEIE